MPKGMEQIGELVCQCFKEAATLGTWIRTKTLDTYQKLGYVPKTWIKLGTKNLDTYLMDTYQRAFKDELSFKLSTK